MKRGFVITMHKNRIIADNLEGTKTAFIDVLVDSTIELRHYYGNQSKKPEANSQLFSLNTYSSSLALLRREELNEGSVVNVFTYQYKNKNGRIRKVKRLPSSRSCISGECQGEYINYSRNGFIKSGKSARLGIPYDFTYEYRRKAKFDDELLRAQYIFHPGTESQITVHVWWCVPPPYHPEELDRWIPFAKVTQAQFIQQGQTYETKWSYDHKCHPTLSTLLDGQQAETPDMILHDHLAVLSKPATTSFASEDPLLPFDSVRGGIFSRFFGPHKKVAPFLHFSYSRLFQCRPHVRVDISGSRGRNPCSSMA